MSTNGVLLYQEGMSILTKLAWRDRSGTELSTVGEPGAILDFALSPDEKRIVFELADLTKAASSDLWMYDLERGMATPFTSLPKTRNSRPVWSQDGTNIVFSSNRTGRTDLYQKPVASPVAGKAIYTTTDSPKAGFEWTRDGAFLLFMEATPVEGGLDIYALPSAGGKPVPVVRANFSQVKPQLSPDNRWLAYVSDEAGRNEVYVQPFSLEGNPAEQRWQISAGGGTDPRWRGDGRELFFLAPGHQIMSVAIKPTTDKTGAAGFSVDSPQPLFALAPTNSMDLPMAPRFFRYAVTADGKRFLVLEDTGDATPTPITVVTNWRSRLKE